MNAMQIGMLILAGGLVVSMFWDKIQNFIPKIELDKKPKPVDGKKDEHKDHDHGGHESDLVGIICCWENLKCKCECNGLHAAVAELDKIFPMFVDKRQDPDNQPSGE